MRRLAGTFLALLVLASLPWTMRRPVTARPQVRPGARRRWLAWVWRVLRLRVDPAPARVDLAVVLDVLEAAIAAGASVPAAIEALGAALPADQGRPLRRAAAALQLGAGWAQAWSGDGHDLEVVARALQPAWTDGVAPGPLLRQAAATIRARRGAAAREAAARLGVRLVLPLGLCLLPAFILLGLVPVLLSTGGDLFGP